MAGSPRDEVFARLGNLGKMIGEPDSVVHDKIGRRIVVRASREKTAIIEAFLAWGSENLWLDAFWHLFSADSRDRLTSRGHANEALHRYARIAEEHPAFHPELVWARLRDAAARQ